MRGSYRDNFELGLFGEKAEEGGLAVKSQPPTKMHTVKTRVITLDVMMSCQEIGASATLDHLRS